MEIRSGYLHNVYNVKDFRRTVQKTLRALRKLKKKCKFEAIAFRGSSGAAMAFVASHELGIPLIHVRKELGHTYRRVEGVFGAKKFVIVDDFVDKGDTVTTIIQQVNEAWCDAGYRNPTLCAVVLYGGENNGDTPKNVRERMVLSARTKIVCL